MHDTDARLSIHELTLDDCPVIAAAFAAQGWNKPLSQYLAYHQESVEGKRTVLVAEELGVFAGYVTLVWASSYPPFRDAAIPEIVDFNVLIAFQRRGIGSALLDEAERRIGQRSAAAGIGVGMTADYGPAQILYVRRGYTPDGRGLFQQGRHVEYGDQVVINDDLALYLTKSI